METRNDYVSQLLKDATQLYLEELAIMKRRGEKINQESIHPRHSSMLEEGIEFAILKYSKQETRLPNNVFGRAALIGTSWANGHSRSCEESSTNNFFGHIALATTIRHFLRREGAELLSDTHQFSEAIKNTIKSSRPGQVFRKLQEIIAHHWVCADGNHGKKLKDKLCHCLPSEVKPLSEQKRRIKHRYIIGKEIASCRIECQSLDGKPCPNSGCEARDISLNGICSENCPAKAGAKLQNMQISLEKDGRNEHILIPIAEVRYRDDERKRTGIRFDDSNDSYKQLSKFMPS